MTQDSTKEPGPGGAYDENSGNLALQQQGFKTSRKTGLTFGNCQEARIRRTQLTLDEFLSGTGPVD